MFSCLGVLINTLNQENSKLILVLSWFEDIGEYLVTKNNTIYFLHYNNDTMASAWRGDIEEYPSES